MVQRIGYLVPEFPGQTHTWIWRERRALQELGIEVDLVSTRRPGLSCHAWAEQAQSLTHYLFPPKPHDVLRALGALQKAGPARLLACVRRWLEAEVTRPAERLKLLALIGVGASLAGHARRRGWSQLHVLSCGDAALLAAFASQLSQVPYSITLLAPLEGYGPNQALKWRDASFGLVMSERLRRELHETLGAAAPSRVAIAPMGVDLDRARRTRPYQPPESGQRLELYTCGRLHPVKGHAHLFGAVAELRAAGRDVRLRVAGGEEGASGYKAKLMREIQRLGLAGSVEFMGALPEHEHRALLEEAHVFVLASLDEGVSVAAMEAMALETPTVVTDVGGMRELVEHGVDALMVPAKNEMALAQAIAQVADQPEVARALSQASRNKIEQQFHHRRGAMAMAEYLECRGAA